MLRIASDDDLRDRLGAAALERSERWDGQVLARQWVETFRTAVARRADPLAPRRVLHGLRPGPLGDLPEDARAWERGVDELAEEDEDVADYVRALEEMSGAKIWGVGVGPGREQTVVVHG